MARIYVAGHRGMVGGAISRKLAERGVEVLTRSHAELDLTDQAATRAFLQREKPDAVVLAAAKVGGIHANNTYPAPFIYENLMIEANVIHAAFESGVEKLILLGSSCIYPKFAEQPINRCIFGVNRSAKRQKESAKDLRTSKFPTHGAQCMESPERIQVLHA